MNTNSTRKIYNTLVAIGYLLDIVAPESGWKKRLVDLVVGCDLASPLAMGFPENWHIMDFWQV